MRARLSDPHGQLLALLRARVSPEPWINRPSGAGGPPALTLEAFDAEPWASLTFTGMRHALDMRLDGLAQEVLSVLDSLALWADEPDSDLSGHFLADVQITERAREVRDGGHMSLSLRLEALTIEE
jgi:hypothetical protein